MSTITYSEVKDSASSRGLNVARRFMFAMLWVLGGLVVTISTLPLLLLFTATAVPLYLSIALATVDVGLLVTLFWFERTALLVGAVFLGVILVSVLAVWMSQAYAMTPPITDAQGEVVPGSIATLQKVQLGDSEQWVSIRGKDVNNPVLLFLAGGPGGSQLTTARHALSELEDHFVVVNWEQPGAGKSFNAVNRSTLTPERYINDGHELVLHLRERFGQDKVYVLGESWGSALGIMLVQRYPDLFHAFIGTAQMVAFLETDLICYDFAQNWAQERGDMQKVAQLQEQGPPPYYGGSIMSYLTRPIKS